MLPFTTYTIPESPAGETLPAKKPVWFVLPHAVTDAEKVLLEKIASALKADFHAGVHCYILPAEGQVSLSGMYTLAPKLLISFGVPPASLGFWLDLRTPGIAFLEKSAFILSVSLTQLEEQPAQKKELWKNMQHYLERTLQDA